MEEEFIKIEAIIAMSETFQDLKNAKLEYIRNHRMVLDYFTVVQEYIERDEV